MSNVEDLRMYCHLILSWHRNLWKDRMFSYKMPKTMHSKNIVSQLHMRFMFFFLLRKLKPKLWEKNSTFSLKLFLVVPLADQGAARHARTPIILLWDSFLENLAKIIVWNPASIWIMLYPPLSTSVQFELTFQVRFRCSWCDTCRPLVCRVFLVCRVCRVCLSLSSKDPLIPWSPVMTYSALNGNLWIILHKCMQLCHTLCFQLLKDKIVWICGAGLNGSRHHTEQDYMHI